MQGRAEAGIPEPAAVRASRGRDSSSLQGPGTEEDGQEAARARTGSPGKRLTPQGVSRSGKQTEKRRGRASGGLSQVLCSVGA